MKHKIVWEKWENPYIEEGDGWDKSHPIENQDGDPFDDESEEELTQVPVGLKVGVTMSGGLVPITEYNNITAHFNLWTGYTNFKITNDVANIISYHCDGVESFDVISPLRMRVGVGKLFRPKDVCPNILEQINKLLIPRGSLLDMIQEMQDGKNPKSG
jgi:hypothetical protein